MLIGELAEMLEVTPKTLRHYEKIDLIPHPERTSNGYRFFGPRAARRAQLVVNLRRLGLTLEEIRTLLDRGDGRSLRQRLLGRLDEQIRDHELGIAQLQGERDELQARYDALVGTPREREGDCICAALLAPCGCKEPSKKKEESA
ncbi:MerR family transcriptional regulator [Aquicoccus porphyridii]|uniref:MerR family transcriptional regulator n=1 Tax=Aquicoccus porphyridii TaxID=1852029 RepID=UPI00273EF614|nr:MerR family transcriptional regulator [Aquicoccus porphyridii]